MNSATGERVCDRCGASDARGRMSAAVRGGRSRACARLARDADREARCDPRGHSEQAGKRNSERFARAESKDNGKPVSLARAVDIPRAVSNFRFFASAIQHFASECHPTSADVLNYTLRAPLGVVGCISPWNLPLYLFTWKIAPALAAGNCVVAKPSEIAPATATMFAELCGEAGLPPGVLNVVHGTGPRCGRGDLHSPEHQERPRSRAEQRPVLADRGLSAAPLFKKLSLELGGKNPVPDLRRLRFRTRCLAHHNPLVVLESGRDPAQCGSRIFVQDAIYDRFKSEFVKRVRSLRVGDPLEATTEQGALVSKQHHAKVRGYLALARGRGRHGTLWWRRDFATGPVRERLVPLTRGH